MSAGDIQSCNIAGGHRPPLLLLRHREDRDSVSAERSHPQLLAELERDRAGAELATVGLANNFLNLQRVWIDLHDVRCLRIARAALARSQDRTVGCPPDVVNAKSQRDDISLDRGLSARQAKEVLASPRRHIQPFTVL